MEIQQKQAKQDIEYIKRYLFSEVSLNAKPVSS